jgi:hypothetical protein
MAPNILSLERMAHSTAPSRITKHASRCAIFLILFLGLRAAPAQTTVLHLKNGDRLAGTIVMAAPPKPPAKHWKGEARLGADFLYGPNDQQIYYGRFKLTYEHPYESNPKQFFRNFWDYSADYGWTENPQATNGNKSVLSANRMYGSDKTDLDIWKQKWYVYDLAGAAMMKSERSICSTKSDPDWATICSRRPIF